MNVGTLLLMASYSVYPVIMLMDPWAILNAKITVASRMPVVCGKRRPEYTRIRFAAIMMRTRAVIPVVYRMAGLYLLMIVDPIAMPRIVENSAMPFIDELMTFPLRARMAIEATADVNVPEMRPKSRKDKTMGIPVKSNLRLGSHGKGILRFEYLRV